MLLSLAGDTRWPIRCAVQSPSGPPGGLQTHWAVSPSVTFSDRRGREAEGEARCFSTLSREGLSSEVPPIRSEEASGFVLISVLVLGTATASESGPQEVWRVC